MKYTKLLAAVALLGALSSHASAQIAYSIEGSTYTENFNHGYATGSTTWTDNSFIPGYYLYRSGGFGTPTSIVVTPTSSSGAFSLVSSPSNTANFALGGALTDGTSGGPTVVGNGYYIGLRLQNTGSTTLTSFTLTYTGSTYTNTTATAAQSIEVSYLTGSDITLASTGWVATTTDLTYTSTLTAGSGTTAVDFTTTSVVKTATISGLSWTAGTDLWIRFFIDNVGGTDRGVAIDDISFSATSVASPVPEPSTYAALAGAIGLIAAIGMRRRSTKLAA